jgi:hypothetical protein
MMICPPCALNDHARCQERIDLPGATATRVAGCCCGDWAERGEVLYSSREFDAWLAAAGATRDVEA